MAKQRADILLVEQGLASTRSRAQAMILAGNVLRAHDQQRVDKSGDLLAGETVLAISGQPTPYVSRGGLKLAAALSHFAIDPKGMICLDVGASTGGFTDCLLQHGARAVYALDVGYGQIAWSLREDPRVYVIERRNVRTAANDVVPEPVQAVVIDVSFISLRQVLPRVTRWAAPGAVLLALVKPQFEVGRAAVGKGGIVTDGLARARSVAAVAATATTLGLRVQGTMDSPITGAKGNQEYLLAAQFAAVHSSGETL